MTYQRESNWAQIENYGDVHHPMYLCLAAVDEAFCEMGSSVELTSCAHGQDTENGQWISRQTQLEYDTNVDQIRLIGCDTTQHNELCVAVTEQTEDGNVVTLTVASCDDATTFQKRHFYP